MDRLTPPAAEEIQRQAAQALAEDIGQGDVSAELISADSQAQAHIICRQPAVVCGTPWADEVIQQLNAVNSTPIQLQWQIQDGDHVKADTILAKCSGPARGILTAERTMLNFLQTLSATATQTHQYVQAVEGTGVRILDTRKTLPGLRTAQKYAVRCGGGWNHRIGLYDAFLIKENHIRAAGSIASAIELARSKKQKLLVEVEVETLDELRQALAAKPDRILLDNFSPAQLETAVSLSKGQIPLEASGGITLNNIADIAATKVDYISIGTLTKDIQSVDLSLLFL